jgi:hypothetical protein
MAASVSGSKTVTQQAAPHLSAATLTTLLAIAPENMTVAQFNQIRDAIHRVPGAGNPAALIGALIR